MTTQTLALSRITTSTWGACFAKARQVYSAVVRPAITFESTVWYSPCGRPDGSKRVDKKPSDIQRECLRVVSGSFRATPQLIVEAESHVMPIQLHLAQLQAKGRKRLQENSHVQRISTFCDKIKRKLTALKEQPTSALRRDTSSAQKNLVHKTTKLYCSRRDDH